MPTRAKAAAGENCAAFDFRDPDRQFLMIEEHHPEMLASFAARALRNGRFHDAFMYADRRCRINPIAGASDFLLRATALARLGDNDRAHDDLCKAVEIDPNYILANRTLLASTSLDERMQAAKALIRNDASPSVLDQVLRELKIQGTSAVGRLSASFEGARGWIAWQGHSRLELEISWDAASDTILVDGDTTHPFAHTFGFAADLLIEWPDDATFIKIVPVVENCLLLDPVLLRPSRNNLAKPKNCQTQEKLAPDTPHPIAIIVPVYSDYDATERCFNTLLSDSNLPAGCRLIIVDDASPDPRVRELAASVATKTSVELICHEANLGFARSVNDAIAMLTDEDVLLLNADTVPPPGFLARLALAAYSADDIGTVTPFSNNGEYTSFPIPFRENRLPDFSEIVALDRLATDVNGGRVVDMPNGTGFCMYITRACLDAVGPLSTEFGRGYFEDVEFCLRAATAGYRNVCATDVFVGHAGSKSFGADKRALVVRNLAALETRFPDYRTVSAAFMAADPLAPGREAIERAAIRSAQPAHLLIVGESTADGLVEDRSRDLAARDEGVLIGTASLSAGTVSIKLHDSAGAIPQSIQLTHPLDGAEEGFCEDFRALPLVRAEILDLLATPICILKSLRMLGIPFDIVVRDNEIASAPAIRDGRKRGEPQSALMPPIYVESAIFGCEYRENGASEIDALWRSTLSAAYTLITTSEQTASVLAAHFGSSPEIVIAPLVPGASDIRSSPAGKTQPRLGIFGDSHVSTFGFLTDLARAAGSHAGLNIVAIGSTFDDLRVMAAGPVFCTGPVDRIERQTAIKQYGVTHLLMLDDQNPHNDEFHDAFPRGGIPSAYLTVSVRKAAWLEDGGVAIPSSAAVSVIADILEMWMSRAHGTHNG
jgi:GT2 family glycosyltransferase